MATEPPCLQLLDAVYTYRSASRSRGNRDNVCWERPQPVSVNPITMDRRTRVRHHACTLVRLHACPLAHLPTYELFLQRSDLPRLAASLRILHRPRSSCFDFRPLARFARKSFVANGEPAPRLHYICGPSAVHLRNSPWVQEADALPLLRARRRNRRILQPNRFGKRPPAAARCTASAPSTTRFSRMRKWLPLVDERVEGPLRRPVNMILVTG
ncbi:hypothetical protein AOQ84DRAFT_368841 [Glonium stellatum]|uniref:Uncharacterized protein n=1 Tax=Glonium stellatum TaxID=574774 RepID=A0A8E2JMU5_9PEZI|nr:hypothetical protein AOQ84DRAFT_368841 [Glonium stellatum]